MDTLIAILVIIMGGAHFGLLGPLVTMVLLAVPIYLAIAIFGGICIGASSATGKDRGGRSREVWAGNPERQHNIERVVWACIGIFVVLISSTALILHY